MPTIHKTHVMPRNIEVIPGIIHVCSRETVTYKFRQNWNKGPSKRTFEFFLFFRKYQTLTKL